MYWRKVTTIRDVVLCDVLRMKLTTQQYTNVVCGADGDSHFAALRSLPREAILSLYVPLLSIDFDPVFFMTQT